MLAEELVSAVELLPDPDGDANDHGGDGDASDEPDADGRAHQSAQLPQNLLLPGPGLLAPESASRGTEEVQVRHLLHAQPAEFHATHGTFHVVARAVVDFHYQDLTPRTRFQFICGKNTSHRVREGRQHWTGHIKGARVSEEREKKICRFRDAYSVVRFRDSVKFKRVLLFNRLR